jgi:hypothetical protein
MNKEVESYFYCLNEKSPYPEDKSYSCKLRHTTNYGNIHYVTKGTINHFNKVFQLQIPYNMPFVSLIISKTDKFVEKCPNFVIYNNNLSWSITERGLPLSWLKQEIITINNYVLKRPKRWGSINVERLEQTFELYPLGHAHCLNCKTFTVTNPGGISHWLKHGIIEEKTPTVKKSGQTLHWLMYNYDCIIKKYDDNDYEHGPNGYFAQKERDEKEAEAAALLKAAQEAQFNMIVENRINTFVPKNKQYAAITLLVSLSRK